MNIRRKMVGLRYRLSYPIPETLWAVKGWFIPETLWAVKGWFRFSSWLQ
jgi:hypothetical protein